MTMTDAIASVLRSDDGPVAILTLNRPDRRNALSRALMRELEDHLGRACHDPKIRALVLTGAGTVFCAGMDLREAACERGNSEAEQHAVVTLQEYADLVQTLHTLPKPTLAALNGDALAGGAGLVAACDFVIASSSAHIGYPEVLRGLVPAIVMHDLTRCLGDRRARQLVLSGELITARQRTSGGCSARSQPRKTVWPRPSASARKAFTLHRRRSRPSSASWMRLRTGPKACAGPRPSALQSAFPRKPRKACRRSSKSARRAGLNRTRELAQPHT